MPATTIQWPNPSPLACTQFLTVPLSSSQALCSNCWDACNHQWPNGSAVHGSMRSVYVPQVRHAYACVTPTRTGVCNAMHPIQMCAHVLPCAPCIYVPHTGYGDQRLRHVLRDLELCLPRWTGCVCVFVCVTAVKHNRSVPEVTPYFAADGRTWQKIHKMVKGLVCLLLTSKGAAYSASPLSHGRLLKGQA